MDGRSDPVHLAIAMKDAGKLNQDTLVATVMSNLGLRLALEAGYPVGDVGKWVTGTFWNPMVANGYNLGGEQSGHVIAG